jgi:hypothetical protein
VSGRRYCPVEFSSVHLYLSSVPVIVTAVICNASPVAISEGLSNVTYAPDISCWTYTFIELVYVLHSQVVTVLDYITSVNISSNLVQDQYASENQIYIFSAQVNTELDLFYA